MVSIAKGLAQQLPIRLYLGRRSGSRPRLLGRPGFLSDRISWRGRSFDRIGDPNFPPDRPKTHKGSLATSRILASRSCYSALNGESRRPGKLEIAVDE
jgi:hypothetical protein